MRLPNADSAVVDELKLLSYLLSDEHPVGRFKAAFFRSLGYGPGDWRLLQEALLEHARTGQASAEATSAHGQKFRVHAMLQGLSGRPAPVVSIWILAIGDDRPRLVTAFPGVSR